MASGLAKSSLAAMVVVPTVAFAHTGVGDASGILHGFRHPISRLDHILAGLMVGIFVRQLGRHALWTFDSVMAVGAVLGVVGIAIPSSRSGSPFGCSPRCNYRV